MINVRSVNESEMSGQWLYCNGVNDWWKWKWPVEPSETLLLIALILEMMVTQSLHFKTSWSHQFNKSFIPGIKWFPDTIAYYLLLKNILHFYIRERELISVEKNPQRKRSKSEIVVIVCSSSWKFPKAVYSVRWCSKPKKKIV